MDISSPPDTTLPKVPRINLKAIREALKANGVTLLDVEYSVDFRCDACGAYDSVDGSLQFRLRKTWWHCWKCHPGGGRPISTPALRYAQAEGRWSSRMW